MSHPDAVARRLIAQIGAHTSWANTPSRTARTQNGRAALMQKFLDDAGGDPQRAESLRKAHFQRLAYLSAESRRKARELACAAERADAELAEGGESAA